mmetsp:Transcript_11987/g.28378  ORF Transcript_11987/g.28378 Transcript_11987/m.28378 type:complete len:145 (-) Transcript_11987:184-618(-)
MLRPDAGRFCVAEPTLGPDFVFDTVTVSGDADADADSLSRFSATVSVGTMLDVDAMESEPACSSTQRCASSSLGNLPQNMLPVALAPTMLIDFFGDMEPMDMEAEASPFTFKEVDRMHGITSTLTAFDLDRACAILIMSFTVFI